MLFDTLRRKNQAEQEEREWNANRPADYVSRNKDAMDSLTGQIGSGFDWDTGSKAYQQYRAQAQANAAASAENAQANAEMLAGGYGSSYADSVAKQGQQQALSGIDNAVPGLRGQALSEYQNQQNDLLSALSGMANTEALDRSAYGSNFANYTAWQNFLANQSEQARNENDNYWNNLWNTVKNIGSAALTAYDGYKGYTQQQWENDFAREQWEYNKNRTDQSDALSAYQKAFNLYTRGAGDAASDVLNRYGLDSNAAGSYGTIAKRQLATQLAKAAATKSSGSSRRSGGSSKSGSGWTNSQLLTALGKYQSLKDDDPTKSVYANILASAGMLPDGDTGTTEATGTGSGLIAPLANPNKWALPGGTTGGSTGKSTGMPYSNALSYAKGWKEQGMDANTIASRLMNLGASDDVIDRAMQNAGF